MYECNLSGTGLQTTRGIGLGPLHEVGLQQN